MPSSSSLLARFSREFLGLDCCDPVLGDHSRRRVYLDTTATSLMPTMVWEGMRSYLQSASANSHTEAHRAGRDTTQAIEDSRHAIGHLVGYDPARDVVLFTSNGATGAINFLARALFPPELRMLIKRFPGGPPADLVRTLRAAVGSYGSWLLDEMLARPLVVTTTMEHHSNLLPWMEAVGHDNLRVVGIRADGTLDLAHLRQILDADRGRIRLVAVTGVSNVTGIVNPVHEIARLAHAAGAQILVDGAQWVPHAPVQIHPDPKEPSKDIDFLVLSGHKLYAPGSRGALVGSLATLNDRRCVADVGGGMVEFVTTEDFEITDKVTAREEAGTPNIPGTISMGIISEALATIGMDVIAEAEHALTSALLDRLRAIPGISIAGSSDLAQVPRAGVVAFSVDGLDHGMVASYLDREHNIAVRNGCFCAQPYVQALLGMSSCDTDKCRDSISAGDRRELPGMVRASLGIYSTPADIDALGTALETLLSNMASAKASYHADAEGNWHRRDSMTSPQTFSIAAIVDRWAGR
jgi:selenocysteine lyase/cysteine desulfurase